MPVATAQDIDTILDQLEQSLIKIEKAQGSAVRLDAAQTNCLSLIEKARDAMMGCVQDREDQGTRKHLTEIFGVDCSRISRMRAYLEACCLTGKHAEDKRLSMCINSCTIVEGVLREKGMQDKLREANKLFIPWRPAAPKEAAPKATSGYEPPAPAPAPAPAPVPAPAPEAAPVKAAGVQNIATSAGTDFDEVASNVPRVLTVTITSELTPSFDFGPGGTMVMEMSHIMVNISTTCEPAWPSSAPAFPPSQDFKIPTDALTKVVFDPSKPSDTPGGTVQTVAAGQGEICSNIPDWLTVQVQRQTMAPWGSHKLLEGKNETEFQYEVEVDSTVSMGEGPTDDSSSLGIGLSVKFTGWLTGHKSAAFQPDGKPKASPVR